MAQAGIVQRSRSDPQGEDLTAPGGIHLAIDLRHAGIAGRLLGFGLSLHFAINGGEVLLIERRRRFGNRA